MTYQERKQATREAMADPLPGDRFSEMLSFWLYVVARDGDRVVTLEASPPCRFPDDGRRWEGTLEEFRERWYYKDDMDDPYVILEDRGKDVEGWAESGLAGVAG